MNFELDTVVLLTILDGCIWLVVADLLFHLVAS